MFRFKSCVTNIVRYVSQTKPTQSPIRSSVTLAFGKYLLLTNTVSSSVLMLIGDVCQQEIEYRQNKLPQRYDYGRLTRMFIVGLGLGPIHHYFYVWLGKAMPARNLATVTKKILIDQFVMSPICIAAFFYSMGALELKPVKECNEELKNKFAEVYVMDWFVWPPTQFINFYYVPRKYQVFYINFVTMLYNVFLSYIKHREMAEEYVQKFILDRDQS
ncbi:mpv17-like protein 2 [Anoplophora glabripennis]|uniref:mpv17-like protein 2 n=1 Tax=Anoplophora glabripennis TaxID=217634 RepID=UPI000874340B|nr:mpv17-like protein 2 [Anoplophora glabripennis]